VARQLCVTGCVDPDMAEEQARRSLLPNRQQRIRRAKSSSSSCVCFPRHATTESKRESSGLKVRQPRSHETMNIKSWVITKTWLPSPFFYLANSPGAFLLWIPPTTGKSKYETIPNPSQPTALESLPPAPAGACLQAASDLFGPCGSTSPSLLEIGILGRVGACVT